MTPLTCASCVNWHRRPLDAHNLGAGPLGECRETVHLIPLPQLQKLITGEIQLNVQPMYATLPENWPACSHYQARVPCLSPYECADH